MQIGFMIWSLTGCSFIGLGIYSFFSKKAMGFWANAEIVQVTDIKRYNAAVARLFCLFGILFIFLGVPLLAGQDPAWILFSVLGVMAESIAAMIVYTMVIEKKYRKR